MNSPGNIFLDNTVLTNFAIVGRQDLIFSLFGNRACTMKQAFDEFLHGTKNPEIPVNTWEKLPCYELLVDEVNWANRLLSRLGSGERACVAAAFFRKGILASDDQLVRKLAQRLSVPVIGSIGILVAAVNKQLLDKVDAQRLLEQMIQSGYYSPISNLDQI
jgi:predicted nucleic acid-binding protein